MKIQIRTTSKNEKETILQKEFFVKDIIMIDSDTIAYII